MSFPKPLSPRQARQSLAQRLSARVDRLRQIETRFGFRPNRVFLVWQRWNGNERGEGNGAELARLEILPTPKVEFQNSIAYRSRQFGMVPDGTVRVSEISALYTFDQLRGLVVPTGDFLRCNNPPNVRSSSELPKHSVHIQDRISFFYEIVEDGRGDDRPMRAKYGLDGEPERDAENYQWVIQLTRMSEDRSRSAKDQTGTDIDE